MIRVRLGNAEQTLSVQIEPTSHWASEVQAPPTGTAAFAGARNENENDENENDIDIENDIANASANAGNENGNERDGKGNAGAKRRRIRESSSIRRSPAPCGSRRSRRPCPWCVAPLASRSVR